MSARLSIANQSRAGIDLRWIKRRLERVLKMLGIGRGEWSITLVNDAAMADLHDRTMKLRTTTDVLTFDLSDGRVLELDTVICADEARRRAKELGHPACAEIVLYAVHSLLHVRGYDDATAGAARRMHRREDEILLGLGVGAVYAGRAGAGKSQPGSRRAAAARGESRTRNRRS